MTTGAYNINAMTQSAASNKVTPKNPNGEMGKDAFLQLLVAQLKYQNPLNPSDPTQFMSQTAQFTMVEKLEQLQSKFDQAIAADRTTMASTMIGRNIRSTIDGKEIFGRVTKVSFGQDGPSLFVGTLPVPIPLTAVQEVM